MKSYREWKQKKNGERKKKGEIKVVKELEPDWLSISNKLLLFVLYMFVHLFLLNIPIGSCN